MRQHYIRKEPEDALNGTQTYFQVSGGETFIPPATI